MLRRETPYVLLVSTILATVQPALAAEPDAARRSQLRELVREDCGSCHGMTLKGGLGPALRPADLAGKHPELLKTIILEGVPGTPMPPWRRFLSEDEARYIAVELKKGMSDETD